MQGPSDACQPPEHRSHRRPAAGRVSGRAPHQARSSPGPIPLGILVTAILLAFGLGAALLPPAFGGGHGTRTTGQVPARASAGPTAPRTAPAVVPVPTPTGIDVLGRAPAPSPTAARSTAPSRADHRSTTELREDEVVTLTNRERARAGCAPLRVDARLHAAARAHSTDMAATGTMSHTGSDGSTPWDRARDAGYDQAMAENVAVGYRTPASVVDGWMNSDGHRANILNCAARAIGVGLAYSRNGTPYWTQLFGRI